jgi:glycosyltransferase involved in cell wall biosynthesis
VAFTGVLSHQPNVDAALYFAESVWPRVRAEVPAARYVIAGRDPDPALLAIAGRDGIEVHADVPDMHALLRTAWIAVAPMRTGAGIKNKVLEAWAAGKPVVMTEIAANGLSLDAGGDTLVCRDARAMAEQVVRLLRDDQERWRTGDGLHDRVRDAHSWMAAGERLSALLDRVRRGARRGAAVG